MSRTGLAAVAALMWAIAPQIAEAQVSASRVKPTELDYANAVPIPMPTVAAGPGSLLDLMKGAEKRSTAGRRSTFEGPNIVPGGEGDGERVPDQVPESRLLADERVEPVEPVEPQEFGTSDHPFTTSVEHDASAELHSAAGKLFFRIGRSDYVCSGALIKPGVVATAAHCVAKFGKGFYAGFEFIPGYQKGRAPFGKYKAEYALAPDSYLDGTDACSVRGVVCENDVAVIVLKPLKGKFPGGRTGWFSYGYDGFGFNDAQQALITELGYPVALNHGEKQQRTDSQGVVDAASSNNTIIGSLQSGGSSGGPWLVNFGFRPKLTGTTSGSRGKHNVVVGATSWGYVSDRIKQQGASPFTSANIVALVAAACRKTPKAC